MVGAAAALSPYDTVLFWPAIAVFGFYFLFPANFLLHGLDELGKKRRSQLSEAERKPALWHIVLWNLPFASVWLFDDLPEAAKWPLAGFLVLVIFYNIRPIRAKTKPLLDLIFSTLYIFPALFAYGLLEHQLPPRQIIIAAAFWAIATYAFALVGSSEEDEQAGKRTTAVVWGPRLTLLISLLGYAAATWLSRPWLGEFSLVAGAVYGLLVLSALISPRNPGFYRIFPYLNLILGVSLFTYILMVVK